MINHRNVSKRHFCPACDHFHEMAIPGLPAGSGVCLRKPPKPFIVGMAQAAIAPMTDQPPQQVPIVRGYFPPVTPGETCAKWEPRTAGEA